MKISQRARYAVTALLNLAVQDVGAGPAPRGVTSAEVARRTGVPEKFLEVILRDLRAAGLVASKRGPDGGHRLAVDASRVTVLAIVEAVDGPLAVASASSPGEGGEAACTRDLWTRTLAAVRATLADVTLEDLRREASAPGPVDYTI